MKETTIAALATYPAESAIGVIRVSGKDSFRAVSAIFRSKKIFRTIKPNHLTLGFIHDGNEKIDEVMLVLFRSPRSYTGEDMAEISCHGSPYIMSRILSLLLKRGCVPAGPGEFTKRAFLNGKMDLSRAEAVADIVSAKNSASLKLALNQLSGRESGAINAFRRGIARVLSLLEAEIDFAHEGIEKTPPASAIKKVKALAAGVESLIQNADEGIMLKTGIKLAICGRPNTGKSSLLNALLKKNRAIVSRVPGTTRDTVEARTELGGLPFCLIDTAGIRGAKNAVEKEGIKRAENAAKNCDIAVLVLDGSVRPGPEDLRACRQVRGKNVVIAVNKSDLKHAYKTSLARSFLSLPGQAPVVRVSAMKKTGINSLTNAVKNIIIKKRAPAPVNDVLVASLRHRESLRAALKSLKASILALKRGSYETAAFDIKQAAASMASITGTIGSEEVLDAIFSKFCVGK